MNYVCRNKIMNNIKYIVLYKFILASYLSLNCQVHDRFEYVNNARTLISINKIKNTLVIQDTIGGCPIDYFEYDSTGNINLYRFGITDEQVLFKYDTEQRIIQKEFQYYFSSDSLIPEFIELYYYDSVGNFAYGSRSMLLGSKKGLIENIEIDPNELEPFSNVQFSKYGLRLISHNCITINRPCLKKIKGPFIFKYSYLKNNLIDKIQIYNFNQNTPVMVWYFRYNVY